MALNPDADIFTPGQYKPDPSNLFTGVNKLNQYFEIIRDSYSQEDLEYVIETINNLINCTPHAINYFRDTHNGTQPSFRLLGFDEGFTRLFRPEPVQSQQFLPGLEGLEVYSPSNYLPLTQGTPRHSELQAYFEYLISVPGTVSLIVSSIGANNIIEAINNGVLPTPPELIILTPDTGKSVRDNYGVMIGIRAFTVLWYKGTKITRNM